MAGVSHNLDISALGATVCLDMSAVEESDREALRRAWADAVQPDIGATDGLVQVLPGGQETERLLASTSQRVTLAALGARRGELWMLHAGGVADEQGRVIVVIGPSGRGKTTAVRALGRRYGYVSDETIAIDVNGRVHPYRKPLSIIEAVGGVKAQHAPSALGLGALPAPPLRVAGLVLLDRRPEAPDEAIIEVCDLGEVIAELVEQSSYLADLPHALQTIAAHAESVGGIRRVVYREAESLAEALAPLFRDPLSSTEHAKAPGTHGIEAQDESVGDGWHRAEALDALVLHDPPRVVLMQPTPAGGATLRVLSGIGPALWAAAEGASAHDLTRIVVAAHGDPGADEATVAVAAALAELEAQGVLIERRGVSFGVAEPQSHPGVE